LVLSIVFSSGGSGILCPKIKNREKLTSITAGTQEKLFITAII
jgi:hypothetical protein